MLALALALTLTLTLTLKLMLKKVHCLSDRDPHWLRHYESALLRHTAPHATRC